MGAKHAERGAGVHVRAHVYRPPPRLRLQHGRGIVTHAPARRAADGVPAWMSMPDPTYMCAADAPNPMLPSRAAGRAVLCGFAARADDAPILFGGFEQRAAGRAVSGAFDRPRAEQAAFEQRAAEGAVLGGFLARAEGAPIVLGGFAARASGTPSVFGAFEAGAGFGGPGSDGDSVHEDMMMGSLAPPPPISGACKRWSQGSFGDRKRRKEEDEEAMTGTFLYA